MAFRCNSPLRVCRSLKCKIVFFSLFAYWCEARFKFCVVQNSRLRQLDGVQLNFLLLFVLAPGVEDVRIQSVALPSLSVLNIELRYVR